MARRGRQHSADDGGGGGGSSEGGGVGGRRRVAGAALAALAAAVVAFALVPRSVEDGDPPWVREVLRCLAQCAALGARPLEHLGRLAENGYDRSGVSPWRLPPSVCGLTGRRCDVLREAFCAAMQCQLNASGRVGRWFPLEGATRAPRPSKEALSRAEEAYDSHRRCAARCASQEYLTISVAPPLTRGAVASAAQRLEECGLVHLAGGAWPTDALDRLRAAADRVLATPAASRAGLKRADLRANRTELFLPLEDGLPDPFAVGVIPAVVAAYLGEAFALDYVSLLAAGAGVAGTQSLHPDVPFFPRTSLSVHTALETISDDMGPTLFCPCTHSVTQWETSPVGADVGEVVRLATALRTAIRESGSADRRRCLGAAYVPASVPAGVVTIYDGAVLHAGLANSAARDRVVLNINVASPPGYEEARNYTGVDPERAREETRRWRQRCNVAGAGGTSGGPDARLEELRAWTAALPP